MSFVGNAFVTLGLATVEKFTSYRIVSYRVVSYLLAVKTIVAIEIILSSNTPYSPLRPHSVWPFVLLLLDAARSVFYLSLPALHL